MTQKAQPLPLPFESLMQTSLVNRPKYEKEISYEQFVGRQTRIHCTEPAAPAFPLRIKSEK